MLGTPQNGHCMSLLIIVFPMKTSMGGEPHDPNVMVMLQGGLGIGHAEGESDVIRRQIIVPKDFSG